MGVSFEQVADDWWVVRMGHEHERVGDPCFEASCFLHRDGTVKGLTARTGLAAFPLLRAAHRAALAMGITPQWERLKMYQVKMIAVDSHGDEMTLVTQNFRTYADWLAYQRAIVDGIFALGAAKAAEPQRAP